MKKILVIKDASTIVHLFSDYLTVKSKLQEDIIGYRYINELYINKLVDIPLKEYLKLATKFDIYLIDQHGKVLGKVVSYEKV